MRAEELFRTRETVLLDGAMGTMLQAAGLPLGARPEALNLEDPALIESIHARYAAAGSRILCANTFGASAHKLAGSGYTVEQVVDAAIRCARRAAQPYGSLVALDIGPLGELLEPAGTLPFEEAVEAFAEIVRAGAAAGADLILCETFTDLYELKAALLACRETCGLPVLASMSFEAGARTFSGCGAKTFPAAARGLGADALGINCSLGPKEILPMARALCGAVPGDYPVFVKPNAGLPRADGSGYDITPQLFAMQMKPYRELGLFAAGGCCGTTPDFIRALHRVFDGCAVGRDARPLPSVLCTPVQRVVVDGITVVGERINPTGKKRFQQALREGDMDYVLAQAISQAESGAAVLDVNVGAPGVDEPALMEQVVKALQSVVSLPLQLDSSNAAALERGLRVYNGKPIVNSVNGEQAVLDKLLPLCKKYGAAVVGLTMDEQGIPKTAAGRVAIAARIRDAALAAGIPLEDIYIDCLTLTATQPVKRIQFFGIGGGITGKYNYSFLLLFHYKSILRKILSATRFRNTRFADDIPAALFRFKGISFSRRFNGEYSAVFTMDKFLPIPLTSIHQNTLLLGKTAAKILIRNIVAPDEFTQNIKISSEFIIKGSTKKFSKGRSSENAASRSS